MTQFSQETFASDGWVHISEAAKSCNLSRKTLENRIANKSIPPLEVRKEGGRTFVHVAAIDRERKRTPQRSEVSTVASGLSQDATAEVVELLRQQVSDLREQLAKAEERELRAEERATLEAEERRNANAEVKALNQTIKLLTAPAESSSDTRPGLFRRLFGK